MNMIEQIQRETKPWYSRMHRRIEAKLDYWQLITPKKLLLNQSCHMSQVLKEGANSHGGGREANDFAYDQKIEHLIVWKLFENSGVSQNFQNRYSDSRFNSSNSMVFFLTTNTIECWAKRNIIMKLKFDVIRDWYRGKNNLARTNF